MRTLLYIGASWCSPCKRIKAEWFDPIREEFPEQTLFIDSAKEPVPFGIKPKKIPTIALMENGKVKTIFGGVLPQPESVITWLLGECDDIH